MTRTIEEVKKEEAIVKDGMTSGELAKKKRVYIIQPPLVLNLMDTKRPPREKNEEDDAYEERISKFETPADIFARIMNECNKENGKLKVTTEKHKWISSARMTGYFVCLIYAKSELVDDEEEEDEGTDSIRDIMESSPEEDNTASILEDAPMPPDDAILLDVIQNVSLQQRELIMTAIKKADASKYDKFKQILEEENITTNRDQREPGDGETDSDEEVIAKIKEDD